MRGVQPEVFTALVVTTIATTAIAGPVLKRTLTPRRQLPAVISKPRKSPRSTDKCLQKGK